MKALRRQLDRFAPHFEKGGRLERWYPLWEAADTFFYTPAKVTQGGAHVRDAMDLKRMMMLVVIATLPCVFMAIFNTGLQANLALDPAKAAALEGWRHDVIRALGVGYSPQSWLANGVHGALYFVPLYVVTMVVGLSWEVLFAVVRKVEVNEGFFVTGMLFPLILPPTTPLWQAALAISFGVVLAKEVFGGTGMNFVNPALAARAFLFFAYPAAISGDRVWNAVPPAAAVDGYSGATLLAQIRQLTTPFEQAGLSWWDAFIGFEPGSMGETSALACLIGAAIIAFTGVGSWRIMLGTALGTVAMAWVFNAVGSATNPWFGVPFWWHMVLGGWAFATAFMATDPVTAPFSDAGRWIYGLMIGALIVLIRIVNPAYPESVMLVILFMNVMAPLIDHVFVRANVRRRQQRVQAAQGANVANRAADAAPRSRPVADRKDSVSYTVLFATVVCVVCALMVAVAAVALQPTQEAKARQYMQKNVLLAAGLVEPGRDVSAAELKRLFDERIEPRLVDFALGELLPADKLNAADYDQRRARNDPAQSRAAPPNRAGIARLPNVGLVYLVKAKPTAAAGAGSARVEQVVLAIEGLAMWGTVYGFLALAPDGNTVQGLAFYEQKETPGLGGEIGNPKWQALWRGRKAFDEQWQPKLAVIKGQAGPAERDPHRIDGLSGATITSNGITRLVQFWLSDAGYGRWLKSLRDAKAAATAMHGAGHARRSQRAAEDPTA